MESCDVTVDESIPYASSVFERACDQEMSENIFVNSDFPVLGDDEGDPLFSSTTPAPELAPSSSTPAEGPATSTSTLVALESAPIVFEGEVLSRREVPQHIQR